MLPPDHPFYKFKQYFYLESGNHNMPIYIFKFGEDGILIELFLNDKVNGPRGRLYKVKFNNEYDFNLVKSYKQIIRKTVEELYFSIANIINSEVIKFNGTQSQQNS